MRRRGRPRCPRRIGMHPHTTLFKPAGTPSYTLEFVELSLDELETLRLVDLLGMEQEEAARQMGITRKSLWIDLKRARKKVAEALTQGKGIRIQCE
ncbi:DUF134 domain-containing protein [Methermicoccus shengliensis]|uniref:UPF0251 protein HA299_01145 n=1 Tax=Methermicoccus shengliensis TaxID=660064 RepID=A0A832RTV8_9EURY|nr:DUF134 domain-containing protein [Methermicoccus shengliensis]KUK30297.1 MAG: hypothetical protein XD62_0644 [Methanosarcinales archeaon 56_1174]MDI3488128.1 uncharacterized protein [Methanosarcinales archaeon]HIH69217.1 DUF134 domain-containing protein [Methermicoccus shengliensis]